MRESRQNLVPPNILPKLGGWGYPFMLVDGITELKRGEGASIRGFKNVSFNEPYCAGHFPGHPIMPGVLIAEVLDQVSHYLQILCDFCAAYEKRFETQLDTQPSITRALTSANGLALIQELKSQYAIGVLASQDLRYKGVVQPGDMLAVKSQMTIADLAGFSHYKVEASVDGRIVCTGRISNYRRSSQSADIQNMAIED